MELLMKLAEEASSKPELAAPKTLSTYTSVYNLQGRPILPPVMTPERRSEMKHHRLTALAIEDYLLDRTQAMPQSMPKPSARLKERSRDASTSTDIQPLVVVGRFRQKLQKSETLIYDNRCNAIIKPLKVRREGGSTASKTITSRLVIEEEPMALAQTAIVQYCPPKFSMLKTLCLPPPSSQKASAKSVRIPKRSCHKVNSEQRTKADQGKKGGSIEDLLNVAKEMQMKIMKSDYLQRSNTSPMLSSALNVSKIRGINGTQSTERLDKLHSQLWQRAPTKNCLIPTSPSTTNTIDSCFPSSGASSCTNDLTLPEEEQDAMEVKKIMVKQCMAKDQPQRYRKPKPPASRNFSSNSSSNSNSNCQRVAGSQSSQASYAAHLCSHAQNSNGSMNSIQRRLNYDPRASLKRSAQPKKENDPKTISCESVQPLIDIKTNELRDKLLEMGRQQRQRFQLLVAKQANEQKRLQDEFEMQQQELRDRILDDFNSLGKPNVEMV